MKRTILLLTIWLAIGVTSFAQGSGKFDSDLGRKVKELKEAVAKGDNTNRGNQKLKIIVQYGAPQSDTTASVLMNKAEAKLAKHMRNVNMSAAEIELRKLEKLAADPAIKRISLDHAVATTATGDPYNASGAAAAAAAFGGGGNGVGVAVFDSGIENHVDLMNVALSVDFTDGKSAAPNDRVDGYGHGTHVAGIIAGSGAASGGNYRGIAPQATLVDVRVLNSMGGGFTADVIAGLNWVMDNPLVTRPDGQQVRIRVLNLSLGHRPYESSATDPLAIACREAVKRGFVVVVSAGNYGKDKATGNTIFGGILSPGNEPSVITVGAMSTFGTNSRADDSLATYSSRGPTIYDNALKPDIVAPGTKVIAPMAPNGALATSYPVLKFDTKYMKLSGTSQAAPVVAGTVALMLEKNPSLTPNAVKAALMFTAENRGGSRLEYGAGYLNAKGAVNLAMNINGNTADHGYWLLNNGLGLTYTDVIGGFPAPWSQTVIWAARRTGSEAMFYSRPAWSTTIVWGVEDTSAFGTTIVWSELEGTTIVWGDLETTTIVWQDLEGQTVVWDSLDGQSIVWDVLEGLSAIFEEM